METLAAIGEWLADNESVFSGAAAIIVLLSVVVSVIGFTWRRFAGRRRAGSPAAADAGELRKITLRDLSAPAPYPVHFAESDGLQIAYAVQGDGPHDLLLAPGIISHIHMLSHLPPTRDTLRALAEFARVAVFDKRGQGLSDPCVGVPDLDARVHDIEAVLDAAGMQRVILLGVSEGGPMCIKFAHEHPERVKGLILLGSAACWMQSADFPMGVEEKALDAMARSWGTGRLRDVFFPSISREQMDDDTYRGFEKLMASRESIRQLTEYMKRIDMRPLLPEIRCPTLVIHFSGDLALPIRLGRAAAAGIPGAEFLEVSGVDHADLSQAPEAIARIRAFADAL